VVEVALSLQFEPIIGLSTIHFAPLWEAYRADFPRVEEQPPLPAAVERFDEPPSARQFQVQVLPPQMFARYWFVSESGNEVVQVQQDRFIFNWRKVADTDLYPRYGAVRQNLVDQLQRFTQFLTDQGLGGLTFNQVEATYVNHISQNGVWQTHAHVGRVFSVWNDDPALTRDLEALNVSLQDRRVDADGSPLGRLYVTAQSAFRSSDNAPIFALTLVARGGPGESTLVEALAVLDMEHDWVIRKFAETTTQQMHQLWGRTDA
jgi:hypothetical protein